MIERRDFVQADAASGADWYEVVRLADELVAHLEDAEVSQRILAVNRPAASSREVQDVILAEALRLGFRDESKGLFADYRTSALRPDFYRPVGTSGVILEVERGKTTINNMDLLDFWKCHICEYASYLVLMVPSELRQNLTMSPRREFATVANRLESFFREQTYTNVLGLVLLGY